MLAIKHDQQKPIKIILIGESGVGKSSVLLRFADDKYIPDYMSTIGVDFRIKSIVLGENPIKLQIWDTGGQERFRSIAESYFRTAHGVIAVYDITNMKSFVNIGPWIDTVKNKSRDTLEIVIVGNKSDITSKREVSYEKGKEFADTNGYKFFELQLEILIM